MAIKKLFCFVRLLCNVAAYGVLSFYGLCTVELGVGDLLWDVVLLLWDGAGYSGMLGYHRI